MKIKFFLILLLTTNAQANSLSEIIKQDQFLLMGNIGIIDFLDEKYIISVGNAFIDGDKPDQIIKAMLIAKANAQSQLSKFANDNVIKVTKQIKNIITVIPKGKSHIRDSKTKYIELINEKNEGPLKNIINIESWHTKNNYYWVIGVKILQ